MCAVEGALGLRVTLSLVSFSVSSRRRNTLDGDVVIGVGRDVVHRHHADAIPNVKFFPSRFGVHLYTCRQTVFYDRQFHL